MGRHGCWWFPAALAVVVALVAAPAGADQTARSSSDLILRAPGGTALAGSWQRWARASLMPTVTGPVTVRVQRCPARPRAAGCVYFKRSRTIFIQPGVRRPRAVLLHELGHLFDLRVMNNRDRGRFRKVMRAPRRKWWQGKIPLAEQFAEGYSFCARYNRPFAIGRYATYDYSPTRGQQRKVCALIVAAAGDRAPAVPAPDAPPVTRADPVPPPQPPPSKPRPKPTPSPTVVYGIPSPPG